MGGRKKVSRGYRKQDQVNSSMASMENEEKSGAEEEIFLS